MWLSFWILNAKFQMHKCHAISTSYHVVSYYYYYYLPPDFFFCFASSTPLKHCSLHFFSFYFFLSSGIWILVKNLLITVMSVKNIILRMYWLRKLWHLKCVTMNGLVHVFSNGKYNCFRAPFLIPNPSVFYWHSKV